MTHVKTKEHVQILLGVTLVHALLNGKDKTVSKVSVVCLCVEN
jgi:hypothetical protein